MELVVCIKQVPMVSELPWDPRTGRLRRNLAEGMMNPACKHALEAALRLKEAHGGRITVISMGPDSAEESLREALALGADRSILLSNPCLAGSDTLATSYVLARAIRTEKPDFDLVLCGCHTADSETGQVGPQLAEEMGTPGAAYVEALEVRGRLLRVERECDGFLETLEMELPAVVTVSTRRFRPRPAPMPGVELAFSQGEVMRLGPEYLGLDLEWVGLAGSASRILRVYSPAAEKKGVLFTGAVKQSAARLLDEYGDRLGGLIGLDLGSGRDKDHG